MLELYNSFWKRLEALNIDKDHLQSIVSKTNDKLLKPIQGDYQRWFQAYKKLPSIENIEYGSDNRAITCQAEEADVDTIRQNFQALIPWRKGPFELFSIFIDSEWQSHMKWNRIEKDLPDLTNKSVLDVGCGNGYYMFRMLKQKPLLVMGIDPGLLQLMQFWSIDKYINSGMAVLPLSIQEMPNSLNCFDVVFSMGVLYHRKSPIHHLKELAACLNSNGHLVLETLVIEGDESNCLIPTDRYAQMRNVWFIPSVDMLTVMLKRSGFKNIKCIDVTCTTTIEQRSTEWMKFHSLKEFLTNDQSKTIEGYDLPLRATFVAQKK